MQHLHATKGSFKATIPVDKLENKVLGYIQKQGSLGERLDMNTIRNLFSATKQEIRLNLSEPTTPTNK